MSDLTHEYNRIMAELENNIEDKTSLKYVKSKVSELFMIFIEKIDNITENYENKMENLVINQKSMTDKISKIENSLNKIESDMYEDMPYDFSIICPYCNYEFDTDMEFVNNEIECPECKNIIELDWNTGEKDCGHNCCGCGHEEHEDFDEDDEM